VLLVVDELDGAAPARLLRQRALRVPMGRVEQLAAGNGDALGIEQDRTALDGEPFNHRRLALEDELCAAVRALREAGLLDREVHAGMAVPE
jgi:hypothetical protein